ncbi:NADH-ubiquinone oxidoreductase chain 1 [Sesamum angolense]|uniref:NADH-ubiquinone oxidoreductase chain 1 n=1 Tax=Sesamum angolense TaxID=2727404 RepID=A0AAE1T6D8_9LAMI|nr:NADH-ubiquinone oxidoreductase chain 1 [Sesamum angolense]
MLNWGFSFEAAFFLGLARFYLSAMDMDRIPLSVGDDRSGASSSKQPSFDLNLSAVDRKSPDLESAGSRCGAGRKDRPDERSTELHPYSPGPCTSLSPGGWPPILDLPISKKIPGSIWFSIKSPFNGSLNYVRGIALLSNGKRATPENAPPVGSFVSLGIEIGGRNPEPVKSRKSAGGCRLRLLRCFGSVSYLELNWPEGRGLILAPNSKRSKLSSVLIAEGNGNEEGKTVIQSVDCCFSVLSLVHIQAFVSHVRASRIRTSFYIASAPIQFKLGEGPVQGPSLHSLLVFASIAPESADQRSEYLPALRWIG